MAETIVSSILPGLAVWLQRANDTSGKEAEWDMHSMAVDALFNQMLLVINLSGTDSASWKNVSDFVQQQGPKYRSGSAFGCLAVMKEIAELLIPKG